MNTNKQSLERFAPKALHKYIDEFLVGTSETDPETVAPITQYEPANEAELVGCFMMYCEACSYMFEENLK